VPAIIIKVMTTKRHTFAVAFILSAHLGHVFSSDGFDFFELPGSLRNSYVTEGFLLAWQ